MGASLRKQMGGGEGASDALRAPDCWTQMSDPSEPQLVKLDKTTDAAEVRAVVTAFMKTLPPSVKVKSVERVQNMPMWQSYAVKRQTILTREKAEHGSATSQGIERVWLFHGT